MGIYIKVDGTNVSLYGTVATKEMIEGGCFLYNGVIPNSPYLVWDSTTNSIQIDTAREVAETSSARLKEIDARLVQLDLDSLRPLRAKANSTNTAFDDAKLLSLDTEAEALRVERATLVGV